MEYAFHAENEQPELGYVYVFSTNERALHTEGGGRNEGTAKKAQELYGAINGHLGLVGYSYAIPTKRNPWTMLPLTRIRDHVLEFQHVAGMLPNKKFFVTRIGVQTAGFIKSGDKETKGYKDEQIAPMFVGSPGNCNFPEQWRPYLER